MDYNYTRIVYFTNKFLLIMKPCYLFDKNNVLIKSRHDTWSDFVL